MHAAFIEGKGEGMEKMNKWECFILQTSWKVVLGHENYPDMHSVLPSCKDKIRWLNVPTSLRKGIQQPCQLTGLTSSLPLYRLLCTCATEKACYRRAGSEGEHLGALPLLEIKCSKGSRQVQFISDRRSLRGVCNHNCGWRGKKYIFSFPFTSNWNLAFPSIMDADNKMQ